MTGTMSLRTVVKAFTGQEERGKFKLFTCLFVYVWGKKVWVSQDNLNFPPPPPPPHGSSQSSGLETSAFTLNHLTIHKSFNSEQTQRANFEVGDREEEGGRWRQRQREEETESEWEGNGDRDGDRDTENCLSERK